MAARSKSAVSDYEHLKFRHVVDNRIGVNDIEDEDFIPLKEEAKPKYAQEPASNSIVSQQHNRSHNNNKQFSHIDGSHDFGNMDSIECIPEPVAWSPGMFIKSNPSLSITPEKQSSVMKVDLLSGRESILEPKDLNKVPNPVAWSPHALLKPSIQVTPDKSASTTTTSKSNTHSKQTTKSTFQADTLRSKEKLTVRFELPSISSGDEFQDCNGFSLSDSDSPIVVKAKDFSAPQDKIQRTKPSSKVYNPMIYSDESFQDDSYLGKESDREENEFLSSLSTSENLVEKLNKLLESTGIASDNSLQHLAASSQLSLATDSSHGLHKLKEPHPTPSEISCHSRSKTQNGKKSSTGMKKSTATTTVIKTTHKQQSQDRKSKPGPHHLSSSVSAYQPPSSGVCVVREMKHPVVSTDFSYPFQSAPGKDQEYEHVFSRPEFNSSLKVRSELDSLCDRDIDVQKAVETQLAKSSSKRTEIQEKAAIYTNHAADQFTNLVDVEPSIDRLCDRVIRMRAGRKSSTGRKKGKKDPVSSAGPSAPDMMEFYSSDLQKESPDLTLPGVVPVTPGLISAPPEQAFEVYRHIRAWNGLQDF